MQRAFIVPLVVTLGSAPGSFLGSAEAAAPAASPDLLDRALPSVVLLLTERPDGATGYGAGLVVRGDGLVLTNLHLVANAKRLSALLFRRDRLSYTPMDGGLGRYLFENQKEVVNAVLVRGDPTSDLALVKVDADTSHVALLELSSRALRRGEQVLALGHPHETVWSFTAGVVSSLHHGAIQHDAAVNNGNSGGPLLTANGEVVGINTSKVLGDSDGVAFARPILLARALLADAAEPSALDLSTPERAVMSCFHAQELASADVAHCFDWDGRWDALVAAMDALGKRGKVSAAELRKANETLQAMGGKHGWIDEKKRAVVRFVRGDGKDASTSGMAGVVKGTERRAAAAKQKALEEGYLARNGLKIDLRNHRAIQEALRMGIRVEEVRRSRDDLAWVLIAGRNTDGSEYRFSECWILRDGRWLQRMPPTPDDVALLPAGWAPALHDFERWAQSTLHRLAHPDTPAKQAAGPCTGAKTC